MIPRPHRCRLGRPTRPVVAARVLQPPARKPATTVTVTVVVWPAASWWCRRGMVSFQYMVKWAGSILWLAGRFSQIWKSCSRLGPVGVQQGKHLRCAARRCRHPLHVAFAKAGHGAQRVGVVERTLATRVMVPNPVRVHGRAARFGRRYIFQPSWPLKSWPRLRPASRTHPEPYAPLPFGWHPGGGHRIKGFMHGHWLPRGRRRRMGEEEEGGGEEEEEDISKPFKPALAPKH